METLLLRPNPRSIDRAASLVINGQVVALPTETVYGLFADATRREATDRIFLAKGRPQDNPLIVHISDMNMLKSIADDIPREAFRLADEFWPGPLTMILKKKDVICDKVTAGLDTVGIRMSSDPVLMEVIRKSAKPLRGPSANRSGRPSPTDANTVLSDMDGRIPLILDGGECRIGVESTVVSLVSPQPVLFRPGYITSRQISRVLGKEVILSKGITEELSSDDKVLSPGLKHRHYAPAAEVTIVNGPFEKYKCLVEGEGAVALCFDEYAPFLMCKTVCYGKKDDPRDQASKLFSALRTLDEIGADKVYAMMPDTEGIGLAIYNRLLRAAAFRVVNV